jgi:hypothetical protein
MRDRDLRGGSRIPYDVSVNVVFLGGADFDSPPPLGTTDRTRTLAERSRIRVSTLSRMRSV